MLKNLLFAFCILFVCSAQFGCKGSKKSVQTPILIGGFDKKDIYFKVQVGAFTTPKSEDDPFFEGVAGMEVMMDTSPNGLTRYSTGEFNDYDEADALEQQLKAKGYAEAFVVAYGRRDDGFDQRIEMPMKQLMELYNKAN
ncbi:MAG: SPOR domain-containing protein [Chitinophagales bacterium]